jgi:hypothetical protein
MQAHEHYREAEKLLGWVRNSDNAPEACALLIAEAHAHATLALAATKGANRTPVEHTITVTKPAQGEEIADQMGGQPQPTNTRQPCGGEFCNADYPCDTCRCPHRDTDADGEPQECVQFDNHPDDHVDRDGRYFT